MNAHKNLFRLKPLTLMVILSLSPLTYAQPSDERLSQINEKLASAWSHLPESKLRKKLESLPEKAQENARAWLERIHFHKNDVPFMRADKNGGIFFVDEFQPTTSTTEQPFNFDEIGGIITDDTFTLHSKPNASNVVYLDFNGHTVSNTAWNETYDPLNALPYDLDGDPNTFSSMENNAIKEIWRRIAEDYSTFDIDVTTEKPSEFNAKTGHLVITQSYDASARPMPANTSGGVAYVGVWGTEVYQTYSPAFVYFDNLGDGRPDYVAEAASHELGHNLGLSHDGTSESSYYGGHGSGFISWGPIMGMSYGRHVTQWSKGEYPDANQFEDDIAIIAGQLGLSNDDHADQMNNATPLTIDANGNVTSTTMINGSTVNKGTINSRTDTDIFSFSTTGGVVSLEASPALETNFMRGSNLDIILSLYDSEGNLLTENNPSDDTLAALNTSVDAGTFYLAIKGSGSNNYSDYSSAGYYSLQGSIPIINDVTPPSPNPMGWDFAPYAIDHQQIDMTAVNAIDDNSAVEYFFECTAGGNGCTSSGWVKEPTYSATGLEARTSYTFRVKARDAYNNETSFSLEASATTTLAPTINQANDDTVEAAINTTTLIPVLDNDTDPENDPLTITSFTSATKGQVAIEGTQISYTAGNRRGDDSFTYTISDSNGNTATATVLLTLVKHVSSGDSIDVTTEDLTNQKGGGKGNNKK